MLELTVMFELTLMLPSVVANNIFTIIYTLNI
jgi:hypothetical protein